MHTLLSKIIKIGDIENALQSLITEGLINEDDKVFLKDYIGGLLNQEPFNSWFSGDIDVKVESSILTHDGDTYRPDRVMIKGDEVILVDYKFGKELPSHSNQIQKYSDLIGIMGYSKVESYLWYVDENRLITV
jgi:hypothetical protein